MSLPSTILFAVIRTSAKVLAPGITVAVLAGGCLILPSAPKISPPAVVCPALPDPPQPLAKSVSIYITPEKVITNPGGEQLLRDYDRLRRALGKSK